MWYTVEIEAKKEKKNEAVAARHERISMGGNWLANVGTTKMNYCRRDIALTIVSVSQETLVSIEYTCYKLTIVKKNIHAV